MNPEIPSVVWYSILFLASLWAATRLSRFIVWLHRRAEPRDEAAQPKLCAVCKTGSDDSLLVGGSWKTLCRTHLMETFRQWFFRMTARILVFYPFRDREGNPAGCMYGYSEFNEILKCYPMSEASRARFQSDLENISGPCRNCGQPALAAYFGHGSFEWAPGEFDAPDFSAIKTQPEHLCLRCCFDQIEEPLRRSRICILYAPTAGQARRPAIYLARPLV